MVRDFFAFVGLVGSVWLSALWVTARWDEYRRGQNRRTAHTAEVCDQCDLWGPSRCCYHPTAPPPSRPWW